MDNTIKLRVILLCFAFAVFGYAIGNFNTLKAEFCKEETPVVTEIFNDTLYATSGPVRYK